MKKGVVIGASRDAVHTIQKARKNGIYVIALDGNPKAEGLAYADEAIVVDISKKEDVCKIIERVNPDFVIPIPIGKYLSTTGYINEKYHLKGIKYNATLYSTDKYLFHKKLAKAALRPVELFLVNKKTNRKDLLLPYPAIMKPRFGSGSRDVFYITTDDQLEKAYRTVTQAEEDFVLEQAVQGIEYSVDGAVINGKLMITLLRKKIITPLPVRQPISSFSVVKTEENRELISRVRKYLQKVVTELEYDDCLLNADLIINEKEVFVIEMAPRPSGHNLHSVFVPQVAGIDIAEEYIKFLLGETCRFETENIQCMQICYFDFEDMIIKKIPTIEELERNRKCNMILWNCNIKPGDIMNKVTNGHSIMGRGFFIVKGKDEEDLIKQSKWVLKQFEYTRDKNGYTKEDRVFERV